MNRDRAGTVPGEGTDGQRVHEAEHFFRCKACGGYFDERDLTWTEDRGPKAPLPHPAQDGIQYSRAIPQMFGLRREKFNARGGSIGARIIASGSGGTTGW